MLFGLHGLLPAPAWKDWPRPAAFWAINIGPAPMVLLSLLPIGLLQTWAAVEHGTWYARPAEFLQTGVMDTLRWLRVIDDTIFAIGVLALYAAEWSLVRLRCTQAERGRSLNRGLDASWLIMRAKSEKAKHHRR